MHSLYVCMQLVSTNDVWLTVLLNAHMRMHGHTLTHTHTLKPELFDKYKAHFVNCKVSHVGHFTTYVSP